MKSDKPKTKAELLQELQLLRNNIGAQDISEQKQALEAKKVSEEKFKTLVESSRDSIFIIE